MILPIKIIGRCWGDVFCAGLVVVLPHMVDVALMRLSHMGLCHWN